MVQQQSLLMMFKSVGGIMMLKIDFGSGYSHNKEYKTCDITYMPNLDYVYDSIANEIIGCNEKSVDEFYLRNVVHHIPDLEKTFRCLHRYLKRKGLIKIIDARKEYYKQNIILDIIWYRYVIPRYDIWFSTHYRDYFKTLVELNFERINYYIENEKEVSIWKKL
jgi:ubiquinone/menaquinone biosynthesis C-methylase UbiE